ncbi:MAG: NUDIX hydrolase [Candidatus Micrarchaeota archaeon]|nr:NUDIX hydrolase [Candidatus Micrarchaeota archaeon]
MGRVLYKDKYTKIEEKVVKVRGKRIVTTQFTHADVAVVVPLLEGGRFLLERQYRHGLDAYNIEFPAGLIDKGERPLSAAKRELEEETGHRPTRIRFMFSDFSNPSVSKRMFHYFFADRFVKGRTKFDDSEEIQLLKILPKRLEDMIKGGRIRDHKTICGYLYWKNYISKK